MRQYNLQDTDQAGDWYATQPPDDDDACVVCGAGPQGRCDPPNGFDGECPRGCSPER